MKLTTTSCWDRLNGSVLAESPSRPRLSLARIVSKFAFGAGNIAPEKVLQPQTSTVDHFCVTSEVLQTARVTNIVRICPDQTRHFQPKARVYRGHSMKQVKNFIPIQLAAA